MSETSLDALRTGYHLHNKNNRTTGGPQQGVRLLERHLINPLINPFAGEFYYQFFHKREGVKFDNLKDLPVCTLKLFSLLLTKLCNNIKEPLMRKLVYLFYLARCKGLPEFKGLIFMSLADILTDVPGY